MNRLTREEFERLAREHAAAVYRTAHRIVGEGALADDVVQDVFLKVWKKPATYVARGDGIDAGRALRWLAVKKALESLRSSKSRTRREDRAMESMNDTNPNRDDPRDAAAALEARRALTKQLAGLPEELRLALVLRYQEGLTFSDIATATAVSEVAAHDRVRRGLEKLRAVLTGLGFGGFALGIEHDLAAATPPAVPADLVARVTALPATAGAGAVISGATLAAAGTFGAALVGVAFALSGGSNAENSTPLVATNTVALSASSSTEETGAVREAVVVAADPPLAARASRGQGVPPPPPIPGGDPFAKLDRATFRGRVTLHPDDAALLPSVTVAAISLRHQSKGNRIEWTARPEADGQYSLQVPIEDDGAYVQLRVEYSDAVLLYGAETKVMPNTTVNDHDFAFGEKIGERAADYTLTALVTDEDGRPVVDREVSSYRRIAYVASDPFCHPEWHGRTDANGRVQLRGKFVGPKRLALGWTLLTFDSGCVDFDVGSGANERTLVIRGANAPPPEPTPNVEVTYRVSGRVSNAATGAPIPDVYHSTTLLRVPDGLDAESIRTDWLPNAPWGGRSVQVSVEFDAKPSETFADATWEKGVHYLVSWRGGFAPKLAGPFDFTAQSEYTGVDLAMNPPATLSGVVRDEAGQPLAHARLVVSGLGPLSDGRVAAIDQQVRKQSGDGYIEGTVARTDAEGRFEISGAPVDLAYRLFVLHPNYEPSGTGWLQQSPGGKATGIELRSGTRRQP
jgi:RNA polymerase sigma-70 factor, ECF subfamily